MPLFFFFFYLWKAPFLFLLLTSICQIQWGSGLSFHSFLDAFRSRRGFFEGVLDLTWGLVLIVPSDNQEHQERKSTNMVIADENNPNINRPTNFQGVNL